MKARCETTIQTQRSCVKAPSKTLRGWREPVEVMEPYRILDETVAKYILKPCPASKPRLTPTMGREASWDGKH